MFIQNMGFTQTVISTLAVIVLIIVTLSLNESVFKETDLSKPLGSLCNYVSGELEPVVNALDTRELLYGTFSVRGANISALILGSIAFGIAYFAKSIDLDMESKYQSGSYMLYGKPREYISGIFFRLCAAGAALAMTVSTLLVVPALGYDAMSIANVNRSLTIPAACKDLGPTQLERHNLLSSVLVLSASSVVAVGFMVYAIKYDAKASASQ